MISSQLLNSLFTVACPSLCLLAHEPHIFRNFIKFVIVAG